MPDIILIDAKYREHVGPTVRVNWSVVQSFIEITTQEGRSYNDHMSSVLSKASNIFHAQIHRQFVIATVIFGKPGNLKYLCFFVDRSGGVSTELLELKGYGSLAFARLLVSMCYGSDELFGYDSKITINRFTGVPISVVVEGKTFHFVTEMFNSPFLFGRGTKVYTVKDKAGVYYVLKDSWVVTAYNVSEVDNLLKISKAAEEEGVDPRIRALLPKLFAGDDNVANTSVNRGILALPTDAVRQRRRFVTGPIGDPITSFCSRAECIQAFIDIADRKYSVIYYICSIAKHLTELKFLESKCDLVHSDVSMYNVVIVRGIRNVSGELPSLSLILESVLEKITSSSVSERSQASSSSALNPVFSASEPSLASESSPSVPNPVSSVSEPNLVSSSWLDLVLDDEEKSFWKSSSQLCDKYGLPYHVKSGGSIIDFDCTHSASDNNSALTRSVCLCLLYLIYLMLIIIYIRRELSLTCLFNFCIQRREWGPSYINYHMTSNRFV